MRNNIKSIDLARHGMLASGVSPTVSCTASCDAAAHSVFSGTAGLKNDPCARRQNTAFTLLEVILAMALTALVLMVLNMAVDLHLRLLDSGRTKVEEARLAREILRIIARDLRGAVPYNSNNTNKNSSDTSASSTGSNTSSTSTSLTQTSTNSSSQSTSATDGTDTTDTEDRTSDLTDAAPQSAPGLYGNAYQLQVDVSRLSRVDQYVAVANQFDGMINADQVSDVKNISYFVINNGTAPALPAANGTTTQSGLIRREIGRASGVFAAQQGQLSTTTDNPEPFAPEVESIQFQYSDGTQWLDAWDSVSYGSLPVAVEITIAITPQHPRDIANPQADIYRMLVSIPTAKSTAAQTTSTSTSTSTSTTSQ